MKLTKKQISEILESADIPNLPIIDEKVFNTDFYQESTYNDYEEVSKRDILFIDLKMEGFSDFETIMIADRDEDLIISCVAQDLRNLYDELTSSGTYRFLDDLKFYIDFFKKAENDIYNYGAGEFLSSYDGREYYGEDSEGKKYYVYIRG